MPELPEVETIVQGLRRHIIGPKIIGAKVFFPSIVKSNKKLAPILKGQKFAQISRHGKYIKLTTDNNKKILIHLRMTGQLFISHQDKPDKHTHLTVYLNNEKNLVYRDVRKFGRWTVIPDNKEFADYINAGCDALAITKKELKQLQQHHAQMKLKAFLLNQAIIAGIGNIYADEICFALKKHPETLVKHVDVLKLYKAIHDILNLSIKHQGTTVSDYRTSANDHGNFQNLLKVYGQKICKKCQSDIFKIKVASRSTYFCPTCQNY